MNRQSPVTTKCLAGDSSVDKTSEAPPQKDNRAPPPITINEVTPITVSNLRTRRSGVVSGL